MSNRNIKEKKKRKVKQGKEEKKRNMVKKNKQKCYIIRNFKSKTKATKIQQVTEKLKMV